MDWKFWLAFLIAAIGSLYQGLSYYQAKQSSGRGALTMRRPYVITGIFMILTWAAVGFDLYGRHFPSPQWGEHPLIQVRDKTFRAQTVPLDGYEYINCDFDDVSFEFQGTAPSRLTDSRIHIDETRSRISILRSQNPVVRHTLIIVSALNKLGDIKQENPNIRQENPK